MSTSAKRLGRRILRALEVLVFLVGVSGGFMLFALVAAGLVGRLPWWVAFPLGFVVLILLLGGAASLAARLKSPRHWLVLIGLGLLLAVSPLLVLAVQGSWEAEFFLPARGPLWVSVQQLAWMAVPFGIALALGAGITYLAARARRTRRQGRRRNQ